MGDRATTSVDSKIGQSPILLVTGRADTGGGPEHVRLLIAAAGEVNFHVAAPRQRPFFEKYGQLVSPAKVHPIPARSVGPRALMAALHTLRSVRPAIVHTHGKAAGMLFRPLCAVMGIEMVHTYHGLHLDEYSRIGKHLYLRLERLLARASKVCVAVSEDERAALQGVGLASKVQVILNGVEIGDQPADADIGSPIRLVSAGRQTFQKDPAGLIDAMAAVQNAHLTMLGGGDMADEVEERVSTAPNVEFVGEVANPLAMYDEFDAYISNSRWEGMPLAVLEALGRGLPCILSDVVGHRQLAERAPGAVYVFERSSSQGIRDALEEISGDYATARRNARGAAELIFSSKRMAGETIEVYRKVLDG